MQVRSRIVAREFKSGDLYAWAPQLEAVEVVISIGASHSPEFSQMHVDVSRAYFHASRPSNPRTITPWRREPWPLLRDYSSPALSCSWVVLRNIAKHGQHFTNIGSNMTKHPFAVPFASASSLRTGGERLRDALTGSAVFLNRRVLALFSHLSQCLCRSTVFPVA